MHPISPGLPSPASSLRGLPLILKGVLKTQAARREALDAAVSKALIIVCRNCIKLQKVVRGWSVRCRIIRPLLPQLSAAWSLSLQPNADASCWALGLFEARANLFFPGCDAVSFLQQPALQNAERLFDDARAVPEANVVMLFVSAAAALKRDGYVTAAAGYMLKAKTMASRLWSNLRIRILIWTLDAFAYVLFVGGAVAASAAALDEAISMATGDFNRDSAHEMLLLTLHLHRITVLLQLPLADWQENSKKALRSLQESRRVLSYLLHFNGHQQYMQVVPALISNKVKFSPSKGAAVQPEYVDANVSALALDQTISRLQSFVRLLQRLQTAVVTRFKFRSIDSISSYSLVGSISGASTRYHVPLEVLLEPLSVQSILLQIVALNAAQGGKSLAQTSAAARCAGVIANCGFSRSSAGSLVSLLHTHLQMCLQLQHTNAHTYSEDAWYTTTWVSSLSLLHLVGIGESSLHPANDSQHQAALHALADMVVQANLPIAHLDCVNQWTTEALPAQQQISKFGALTEAHQLRLQYVGEVLPLQAVVKGLHAVLTTESCPGIQIPLHALAAIDASMLALLQHDHQYARELLQLTDVALSSLTFHHRFSSETKLSNVIAKNSHDSEFSASFRTRSFSVADLLISANVLLPFLRATSNALHFDSISLQQGIQILVFKLCSVAITAQRLIAESQLSSKMDCPSLQDCFDRGKRICSEIMQSVVCISQACDFTKTCSLLQIALDNSEHVHDSLIQGSESDNATTSGAKYAIQLRLCSSVLRGQLEGCAALQSQAVAILRLSWDIDALLMYGRCLLMKKMSNISGSSLKQMAIASAEMLDSDCELHGAVLGNSLPSLCPPLLRRCTGFKDLLLSMRSCHRHVAPSVKSSSVVPAKKGSSCFCIASKIANRESCLARVPLLISLI